MDRRIRGWLLGGLLGAAGVAIGAPPSPQPPGFSLRFRAIGTPEFVGPTKIDQPGFIQPIAEEVWMPRDASCLAAGTSGEFEAYVNAQGVVETIKSKYEPIQGTACQKNVLFPMFRRWKFHPATWEGKPTPVYLAIGLDPGPA